MDRFVRPLLIEAEREDVKLVHAPERIIPGNMVYELLHNNRTIGADDPEVGEEVAKIYATFCQGEISVTDIRTAEMTKSSRTPSAQLTSHSPTSLPRSAVSAAWTWRRSSASPTSTRA